MEGETGYVVGHDTMASRVECVAAGLAARGFAPSDVLALCAPNQPRWAGVALGAMAADGVVTAINSAYTPRELEGQLADSRASVLVTVSPLVPASLSAASKTGLREVIVLGRADGATPVPDLISGEGLAPDPEIAPKLQPCPLL